MTDMRRTAFLMVGALLAPVQGCEAVARTDKERR